MDFTLELLENSRIGPDYFSKKNRVFRSSFRGENYVVKIFRGEWRQRASYEHSILVQCREKGLRTPVPVALLGSALIMEYVPGENVIEAFDRMWSEDSSQTAEARASRLSEALASWLSSFHRAFEFAIARNDTILRNFILQGNDVYGLDFEEATNSDSLADLGQLCSSILGTTPMFTKAKLDFSNELVSRYWALSGVDRRDDLGGAVAAALRHYASFRTSGAVLLKWANMFESGEVQIGQL